MAAVRMFVSAPLRVHPKTRFFSQAPIFSRSSSSAPRVASSSLWESVIPKAFRRADDPVSVAEREKRKLSGSKEWNPATFFIAMAILIGSNAIQMIALRNERLHFSRRTTAHLALLRETIERVRKGEDVDVEKVLGTGDPTREQAWEEVMKEIEEDAGLGEPKEDQAADERTSPRAAPEDGSRSSRGAPTAVEKQDPTTAASNVESRTPSTDKPRSPGFY